MWQGACIFSSFLPFRHDPFRNHDDIVLHDNHIVLPSRDPSHAVAATHRCDLHDPMPRLAPCPILSSFEWGTTIWVTGGVSENEPHVFTHISKYLCMSPDRSNECVRLQILVLAVSAAVLARNCESHDGSRSCESAQTGMQKGRCHASQVISRPADDGKSADQCKCLLSCGSNFADELTASTGIPVWSSQLLVIVGTPVKRLTGGRAGGRNN